MKFGPIASGIQFLVLLLGYPMQVLSIYQSGSAEGVSIMTYLIFLACHIAWGLHGYQVRDNYIFLPQIPSAILCAGIISECVWFGYLA